MNICVYGAGAIGGSIAARLFASGEKVSVIARGAHAEAIRERGLTVLAGDSRIEARVRCAGDPAEPGVILNTSPQRNRLVIGAAHDASTQAVADVAALFVRAGYDAPVTPNIRQELWNKLVLYLGVSPVAALTHCALDRNGAEIHAEGPARSTPRGSTLVDVSTQPRACDRGLRLLRRRDCDLSHALRVCGD
jgi:ketopantoate reductase